MLDHWAMLETVLRVVIFVSDKFNSIFQNERYWLVFVQGEMIKPDQIVVWTGLKMPLPLLWWWHFKTPFFRTINPKLWCPKVCFGIGDSELLNDRRKQNVKIEQCPILCILQNNEFYTKDWNWSVCKRTGGGGAFPYIL